MKLFRINIENIFAENDKFVSKMLSIWLIIFFIYLSV